MDKDKAYLIDISESMRIAGEICVYTNFNLIVESL